MASSLAITISPVFLSTVMHPTPHPVSSAVLGGCPCPLPDITSFSMRPVVEMNKVVRVESTRNSTPVMGSSDSWTMRCLVPRSWIRSPRITVTAPLAKPTASCDRSSVAVKADILAACQRGRNSGLIPLITHRKRLPSIVDAQRAQAGWYAGLLDGLVQSPDLQHWLST